MNDTPDPWHGDEPMPRWLIVDDVPPLSGESALALIELLWALSASIDSEYAAQIIAHRRSGQTLRDSSRTPSQSLHADEHQLTLDLGDDDYF